MTYLEMVRDRKEAQKPQWERYAMELGRALDDHLTRTHFNPQPRKCGTCKRLTLAWVAAEQEAS